MDAPDDPGNLLELPTVTRNGRGSSVIALDSRLVLLLMFALSAAASPLASTSTAARPSTAASALATRRALTGSVSGKPKVEAAARTGPVSPALLS